jgi:hypothetical protein
MITNFDEPDLSDHPARGVSVRDDSVIAADLKLLKIYVNQTVVTADAALIFGLGGVVDPGDPPAPNGAIFKVAGMTSLKFSGTASCAAADVTGRARPHWSVEAPEIDIEFDIEAQIGCRLGAELSGRTRQTRHNRRDTWFALPNNYQSGALRNVADQVGPALQGAVIDAGGKAAVVCYADI